MREYNEVQIKINKILLLWGTTLEELDGINQFMTKEHLESPFIRRLIIRNTFVIIETYLYVTKEIIKIKIENSGDNIDWQKLAILNEKRVEINQKGQIET